MIKKSDKHIVNTHSTTKQFILIFLPLFILTLITIGNFVIQEKKTAKKSLLLEEQQNLELKNRIVYDELKSIFMDLIYISAHPLLHQIIETDKPADHLQLSDIFVDFCKSKAIYDQIRFLDETGLEIIRINFNQGIPSIVPEHKLQNKAKRYYFADTIQLEPGQIFISPLDLNIEQGKIEQPLKPMIRFGTPIVDLNGQKKGVVLLNYFGNKMLRHLEEPSIGTIGKFALLNSQGYWLKGFKPEDEWGFMYDDRRDRTLAKHDIQAWRKISNQKSGQFVNTHGLYTFNTIYPTANKIFSSTGAGKPFDASKKTYSGDKYYWKIISHIPNKILKKQLTAILYHWVVVLIIFSFLLIVFSWLLAFNITRRKLAERSVMEKAIYLNHILNSSTDYAIAATDLEFCIVYYNPMAEKLFGYSAQQVIGKKVQDIHTKENVTPERFEKAIEQVRKTGYYEYSLVKNTDKGTLNIYSTVSGIYNEHDELIGFTLFSKDETNRLATEAALKKSEKQYKSLFENMTDVFYRLDKNGIVLEVSPSALNLYGYSETSEIIGKHADNFIYNIKDNKTFIYDLQKKGYVTNYIFKHKRSDGSPLFVETNSKIIYDVDGKPDGVTGIFRDITDRKKAEKKLRENEKKFKAILNATTDSVSLIRTDGTFHSANNALLKSLGRNEEELIGKSFFEIFSDEVAKKNRMSMLTKIIESKTQLSWEDTNAGKYFENSGYPIFNDNGDVKQVAFFAKDITRQKQVREEKSNLEAQLQQTQKIESIGTLAGGIAHDFNNILFPIVGYSEMLLEDIPEKSPFRNGLNQIYQGALRASALVKQILTFSRQQSGDIRLVKIQAVIKEALKLIRSTIPTTIEIKQNLRSDCGPIKADPTQIHQIVMNLATNAYHAMEKNGGEIKINLKEVELEESDLFNPDIKPGTYACLSISDNGKGMDNELIEKIFDPFFTTKEIGKGTGMGLSVVHGIVQNMNGAINVNSEPDKGTEFHVYLPLAEAVKEQIETQTTEPIQGGTEHILLVDDEKSIIGMEQNILKRLGYKVTSRLNSLEALETFKADPTNFNLVITDMAMPNMSGDKLTVELTKIRPDIPVLLCTGFSDTMSEEKAESLGINGFLLKPIVITDLAHKIREILDANKE
ncbi:MAG: PAS domain S-box protein [Desulfobacteraceae bacterium]|nr:PAS domain S-box protein [Desulfobacteraceae bacterium]